MRRSPFVSLFPFAALAFSAALAFALAGCGGPPRARNADDEEDDEDSIVDEEPEESDDPDEQEGFVDSAALRGRVAQITLGEPVDVPGTGVSLRPPQGATPLPFGAGFMSIRDRLQISIVVAVGPESMLEAVRTGGQPNGPEPTNVENVTVAGQSGRIGRDHISAAGAELERTWLLVHDGQRGLAIVATYEAGRASAVRNPLREALTAVNWNRRAQLDASLALGIEVGPVEGMTASRSTTANVVLLGRGASFPPEPGQPVVTISPLPMQLASERTDQVCAQLVARLLPVPTSDIQLEGRISNGALPGCERLATADNDQRRVAAYAALLFADRAPLLVTGTVDARELARWRPRFASAARSVRARR